MAARDPIELKPLGLGSSASTSTSARQPPLPPRHPAATSTSTRQRQRQTGSESDDPPPDTDTGSAAGSLGRAYRLAEDKARAAVHLQEGGLDAVSVWGLVLAAWSALLAIPLLLFPRILLFFAQVPPAPASSSSFSSATAHEREEHYDALTPLESHLCLTLSLGLFALSLVSLFVLVPTYAAPSANPSRKPLLGVLVGLETVLSLVLWNTGSIGGLGTVLAVGHTVVAAWGWWVVVFALAGDSRLAKRGNKGAKSKVPERLKKL